MQLRVVSGLSGHISRWLLEGVIDFGLIYANSIVAGLDVEKLLEENLFLAARDQAALDGHINARGEFPAHKLTGLPLVLPGREHGLRTVIKEALSKVGVGLHVTAEVDAPEQQLSTPSQTVNPGYLSACNAAKTDGGFQPVADSTWPEADSGQSGQD